MKEKLKNLTMGEVTKGCFNEKGKCEDCQFDDICNKIKLFEIRKEDLEREYTLEEKDLLIGELNIKELVSLCNEEKYDERFCKGCPVKSFCQAVPVWKIKKKYLTRKVKLYEYKP